MVIFLLPRPGTTGACADTDAIMMTASTHNAIAFFIDTSYKNSISRLNPDKIYLSVKPRIVHIWILKKIAGILLMQFFMASCKYRQMP
jgi:hypothetical protein